MYNVLVNAGHRVGIDNGGHHGSQTEAKTNVNAAIACGKELKRLGYNVTFTHELAETKGLKAADLLVWANRKGIYNFCISIHQNDAESEAANGAEVCWNGSDHTAKVIAQSVQRELVALGAVDRGIKPRSDLAILKIKNCHSILTEGAFLTTADYQRINTVQEQQAQGVAIARGFHRVVKEL